MKTEDFFAPIFLPAVFFLGRAGNVRGMIVRGMTLNYCTAETQRRKGKKFSIQFRFFSFLFFASPRLCAFALKSKAPSWSEPDLRRREARKKSTKNLLTTTTLCCYHWGRLHYVAVTKIMRCPKCGHQDDKVIDSRASREGSTIRRRRECLQCSHRFTTYEEIEHEGLMVVKRDGRREEFSKDKLLSGLKKACQKRPISPKVIEELVENIMEEITDKYEREVPGMAIGERVMEGLCQIDKVAYVRFASVYRRFEEATEFVREVNKLEAHHDSTQD